MRISGSDDLSFSMTRSLFDVWDIFLFKDQTSIAMGMEHGHHFRRRRQRVAQMLHVTRFYTNLTTAGNRRLFFFGWLIWSTEYGVIYCQMGAGDRAGLGWEWKRWTGRVFGSFREQ